MALPLELRDRIANIVTNRPELMLVPPAVSTPKYTETKFIVPKGWKAAIPPQLYTNEEGAIDLNQVQQAKETLPGVSSFFRNRMDTSLVRACQIEMAENPVVAIMMLCPVETTTETISDLRRGPVNIPHYVEHQGKSMIEIAAQPFVIAINSTGPKRASIEESSYSDGLVTLSIKNGVASVVSP